MGRPPKPAALKRLHGTARADRPQGVELPPGCPDCPKHITGEARKQWRRVVPELVKHGIVSLIDASILELYCTAYANWRQAQAEWNSRGLLIDTPHGPMKNPAVIVTQDERKECARLGNLLGLDPSGRVKLKAEKPVQAVDEFEKFLATPTIVPVEKTG